MCVEGESLSGFSLFRVVCFALLNSGKTDLGRAASKSCGRSFIPPTELFVTAIRVSSHSANLSRPPSFMLPELKAFPHELRPIETSIPK
jgi:hypothetical protein